MNQCDKVIRGTHEKITCSVGVATFAGEANGALFVDRADRALYQAKEEGRNRVAVADDPANPADAG
jgi:diguanylate cyclase (GGDEF)-like protein